ncbi:hypothetical protein ABEP17_10770 [Priestia flexa]|uniref:hypothetical protein n=1 Tax=Priestia flexa TaxID=86664 RepID=UPI003D2655BE
MEQIVENVKTRLYWSKVELRRNLARKAKTGQQSVLAAHWFDKPYFLNQWWEKTDIKQKPTLLLTAWIGSRAPNFVWHYSLWLPFFEEVGFVSLYFGKVRTKLEDKPKEPIRLYRGCHKDKARCMSWTPDPSYAKAYKDRSYNDREDDGSNKIYTTLASPDAILAKIETGRDYVHKAYLVNPDKLGEIEEYKD